MINLFWWWPWSRTAPAVEFPDGIIATTLTQGSAEHRLTDSSAQYRLVDDSAAYRLTVED